MQYTNEKILDAYDKHRIMFGIYWVSLHSFRRRLALWWSLYDATYTKKLTSMEVSQRGNEQRKLNKIAIEAKKGGWWWKSCYAKRNYSNHDLWAA